MEAHGYNWNLADRRCHVTSTVERNPYCYTPSNWLDRQLYIIEQPEPYAIKSTGGAALGPHASSPGP